MNKLLLILLFFTTTVFAGGPFGVSGQLYQGGYIPDDGSFDKNNVVCTFGKCMNVLAPVWPFVIRVNTNESGDLWYQTPGNESTNMEVWHTVDVTPFLPDGVIATSVMLDIQRVLTPGSQTQTSQLSTFFRTIGTSVKNPTGYTVARAPHGQRENETIEVLLVNNQFEFMWTIIGPYNGIAINAKLVSYTE